MGQQSYLLAVELWLKHFPCRSDLVLLVQIDVLDFHSQFGGNSAQRDLVPAFSQNLFFSYQK